MTNQLAEIASNGDQILSNYLAGVDSVRQALVDLNHTQLTARPVAGKWSIQEVLCHLVDTDLNTSLRIRAILLSDNPCLSGLSHEQLSTLFAAHERDVEEELALFCNIRSQTARILRAVGPHSLARAATLVKLNGEEVERNIGDFLTGISAHVKHHLSFVHEKRRALGLPAPLPEKIESGRA